MRCVLIGNYGVDNLGDEALKTYFLHAFPAIEWTTVSARPVGSREVPRLPFGMRSLCTSRWWKTLKAIKEADAVVFGGGSLFTDIESVRACFLWGLHAFVAFWSGTPVFLAFQGMGPYKTAIGEGIARRVAAKSVFVSVRDDASMKRVRSWGLNKNIIQTFDPVFSLMKSKKIINDAKNVFIAIPRHNSDATFAETVHKMVGANNDVREVNILLMQEDDSRERSFAEALQKKLAVPSKITPVHSVETLMRELAGATGVVAQRFHGALAALAADVPVTILPQEAGDKLSQLTTFAESPGKTDAWIEAIARGEDALRGALLASA